MNKELEFKNRKVIVTNEFGDETEREMTSNIEQILITENNIEEIEKLIYDKKTILKMDKSFVNLARAFYGVSAIWFLAFISNLLAGNILPAVGNILCSILWTGNAYILHIKPNKPKLKSAEKSIIFLEEQLDLQNEQLNKLQKEKNNNCNYIDTSKKHFTTSDKILELRNKLLIIEDYQHNKAKYLKLYKAGIIKGITVWYNNNNLKFLEELIKNDLEHNTKSKTREKQKTLTK